MHQVVIEKRTGRGSLKEPPQCPSTLARNSSGGTNNQMKSVLGKKNKWQAYAKAFSTLQIT